MSTAYTPPNPNKRRNVMIAGLVAFVVVAVTASKPALLARLTVVPYTSAVWAAAESPASSPSS